MTAGATAVPSAPAAGKEPAGEDIEAAEAAFLAEMNSRGTDGGSFAVEGESGTEPVGTVVAAPPLPGEPPPPSAALAPLPTLDKAIARLSPELRDVLEDLFRAKFTSVRRIPESSLDAPPPPPATAG